jgi:DNA-binding winged helix-turn-helix (wHTH) protein/Tfp pilus assembly protein PilF
VGATLLRFGDFQFDPEVPLLTYGSRSLELAPKALELLAILLNNAGQVVRKDDLLSLVWPQTVVEESNLAVHVSSLRKALAEHGGAGNCIETVPKRGYRFIAPVRAVSRRTTIVTNETSALFDLVEHYLQQDTAAAWRRASATYEKCIEIDPLNARARAGLADSLLMRFIPGDLEPEKLAGAATYFLAEAGEIDPACPDVHLSLSRLHYVWHWNWQRVTEEVQHARELATNNTTKLIAQAWGGYYLALLGDLDRGLRELKHAAAGLPLEPLVWYFLAQAYYLARDCTRAAVASTEALELHPNCWYLHTIAGKALAILGDYSEALRHLRMSKLLYPEDAGLVAAIAWVHALAGKRDHAVELLRRITTSPAGQQPSLISVAMVHAALGDTNRAVNVIEKACAGHDWYVAGLKRDCCLDSLRTDRRFRWVLSRAGI